MMNSKCYLYCNSEATSENGLKGFLNNVDPLIKRKRGSYSSRVRTTTEYAFALEFNSVLEAVKFNNKNKLPCIVFMRIE